MTKQNTNPRLIQCSGVFVDGYDARARKYIAQNNHPYRTTPLKFLNREGSIFSCRVATRMLICACAMNGLRPLLSQSSVQNIFDHFVTETVTYRIPSTLCPCTTVFTRMPNADSMCLSLQIWNMKKCMLRAPRLFSGHFPLPVSKKWPEVGFLASPVRR